MIARPAKLVDETNFGLVIYNHVNFYRFEETSSYLSVKRISVFSAFHWSTRDTPPASQCITYSVGHEPDLFPTPTLVEFCRP